MTATTIMSTNVVTLKPDDTIADALQLMCKHAVHNLPVLDNDGTFLGLFSLRRLSRELLPKAAKLNESSLLMHINFMPDDTDELLRRLTKLGQKPVSSLLEKAGKLRLCHPDTTLPELLQLLFESPISLPVVVVEGKKKKLAGMVSNWDVLTKLSVNLLGDKDIWPYNDAETNTPP
ncbi:MAG: CBS domain-containing protein [Thiohalomonas sp.]|nr:CBS domain-containing protein [Thiohalomonas sp.]